MKTIYIPPIRIRYHTQGGTKHTHTREDMGTKLNTTFAAQNSSQATVGHAAAKNPEPSIRKLIQDWLAYIMMPCAMLAWVSTKRWTAVLGAGLAMPLLAIVQGSISILTFRLSFGDAPLPIVPSHGVVVVNPGRRHRPPALNVEEKEDSSSSDDLQVSQQSFPPSRDSRFLLGHASSTDSMHKTVLGQGNDFLSDAVKERPLTLLVVGDSVGIGVGQSESATPVMPEAIAKTLSKKMGGRMVYWTCHGGTGASSAWLVRELERGVGTKGLEEEGDELESLHFDARSSGGDTVSVSDDSSAGSLRSGIVQGDETVKDESISDPLSKEAWQQRLRHHRRRFHPEFMGPYDIAVVLTGPNDLKAAVFPFLLTGEDGEFRKQAQERGGGQTGEMFRVLETLRSRMASSIRNARDTFQAATDSVRERMEETVERVVPGSNWGLARKRRDDAETPKSLSVDIGLLKNHTTTSSTHGHKGHMPLIFLPGLPARANPMTQHLPLRWLLVPLFEILDYQKQILARESDGDVIFVPAPTTEEFVRFMNQKGSIHHNKNEEEVLVNLRDARRSAVRRTQAQMKEYYNRKGQSAATNNPFKRTRTLLGFPPSKHLQGFSADGVHPNDLGYDYWGRHIANTIYEEWQRRHSSW